MFPVQPPDESFLNPQATAPSLPPPLSQPSLPPQAPGWAQLLPALFSIGARIGGNREIGPAAQHGYTQGYNQQQDYRQQALREHLTIQEESRRQQETEARIAQTGLMRQMQEEQRRQQAIRSAVDDLRQQKFPKKADYDTAVTAYETSLGVRPNALRTLVPYTGPTAETDARHAIETLVKSHGPEMLATAGFVEFDRDGDGVLERVPITEAAALARYPVLRDAQGGVLVPPKAVKPENLSEFETRLQSALDVFTTEKGRAPTAQEKDSIMTRVARAPADPTLQAIRELTLQQARQNATTKMYSPGQERAVNMLADDYARDSKDFITRAQSYDTVIGAAKDPTAAGDLSLIFAYMKMLDPGSVVREGEFATAQNSTGVPDRIRNLYNQVSTGVRLNPAQRADFLKQAGNIYSTSKTRQDRITAAYRQRAERRGLDPNDVIVDYSATSSPSGARAGSGDDVRTRARQILGQGGYDTSDASIDRFLANPKNKALLGVK